MALTHNSKLGEGAPKWGSVDKTKLPRNAHADKGDAGKKSTWKYPHHWVKDGGDLNDDGVYASGDMYLHEGGLNAAWSAANGGRSGDKAPAAVLAHLQAHRKALGKKTVDVPQDDVPRHLQAEQPKLTGKAVGDDAATPQGAGFIEGYAAVWGNTDLGGERMMRGAFVKSVQERVPQGRVKLMAKHFAWGGDVHDCIGTVTAAKEDEYGLWFHADLVPDNEQVADVLNKVKTGHVGYCSVGYGTVRWQYVQEDEGDEVLEHLECKLYEVTLTVQPMNELAMITAAKALGLTAEAELAGLDGLLTADPRTPEGRAQLAAAGPDKLAKVQQVLGALCAKVNSLLEDAPQDTGDGDVPPAADLHALARTTARCKAQLAITVLEWEGT